MTGLGRSPLRGGLLIDAFGRPRSAGAAALLGQEHTSSRVASLASRELQKPGSLSLDELSSLGGSVLTQAPPRRSSGAAALLGEQSSPSSAEIAARAVRHPATLTKAERQALAGSALTQTRDREA